VTTIDHGDLGPDHPDSIADGCPQCIRVARLRKAFRDFGYTDLTIAETRDAYHLAMARKPTAEDGIIAMLTWSQLRDAGLVADTDSATAAEGDAR
jgi:hypothetical protein